MTRTHAEIHQENKRLRELIERLQEENHDLVQNIREVKRNLRKDNEKIDFYEAKIKEINDYAK